MTRLLEIVENTTFKIGKDESRFLVVDRDQKPHIVPLVPPMKINIPSTRRNFLCLEIDFHYLAPEVPSDNSFFLRINYKKARVLRRFNAKK